MKGHHHRLAALPSPITRRLHHTRCYLQCMRPLARWGIGLTVLLEKIKGNNFVQKLQAICLLKTDFNWINKIIFARHMIVTALEQNLIPGECFLKKRSNCINVVMTKIFICNESRIHYHDACIAGNDFGDCYKGRLPKCGHLEDMTFLVASLIFAL